MGQTRPRLAKLDKLYLKSVTIAFEQQNHLDPVLMKRTDDFLVRILTQIIQ
jgi:hypothetical protein